VCISWTIRNCTLSWYNTRCRLIVKKYMDWTALQQQGSLASTGSTQQVVQRNTHKKEGHRKKYYQSFQNLFQSQDWEDREGEEKEQKKANVFVWTTITIHKLDVEYEKKKCITVRNTFNCRTLCPRGLRCRSAAARLLRLWVRIPPEAWMFICCECCLLSGRGLCDELITLPEESYRLWCVVVCDLDTSWIRRPWPTGGCRAKNKQIFSNDSRYLYRLSKLCF